MADGAGGAWADGAGAGADAGPAEAGGSIGTSAAGDAADAPLDARAAPAASAAEASPSAPGAEAPSVASAAGPSAAVADQDDPQALWQYAESLRIDDPERPAAYLAAARAAESAGLLDDAGLAYAEHAQAAVFAEQEARGHRAFERGVRLLIAGGAPNGVVAQVISAWAPIAVLDGNLSAILEILQERLGQAEDPLERARLADALARLIASAPEATAQRGLDRSAAIALAEEAAGAFETAGSLDLAAHAGWLLARLQRDQGLAAEATASYRAVLAAFGSLRERENRAEAAGELIAHLRDLGESLAADEVARSLGERLR